MTTGFPENMEEKGEHERKDIHRWATEFPSLTEAASKLLEVYAHIPSNEIEKHITEIREQAFAVYPYPCIGHFRFLDLGLYSFPVHDEVLDRLRAGQKYLDLGCCFGQEIRYLASQGCPSENLYGADLRPVFIEYGYKLFLDKETLKATFLTPADIFEEQPLAQLNGKMDVINASSFFHLFSWEDSVTIAKRVLNFLCPVSGSLILGRQVGRMGHAGPKEADNAKQPFRHNSDSWQTMWEEVGRDTGMELEVDFWWDASATGKRANMTSDTDNIQRFGFSVRRV